MNNMLQWVALAACLLCLIWRFPSMVKGRNRGLFWIFAMASLCVGLSIPEIYLPVDALLGGVNLANVILRLSLFAVFFLLASRIAAAYKSPVARRMVRGPLGITILVICSAGIWITYFTSDLQGSSAGLERFTDQASVMLYKSIGLIYPAYASICMAVPTWRAAFSQRPKLDRAAAMSMCIGFIMVCMATVTQISPWDPKLLMRFLSFGSILFVAAGLAMVWASFLRRPVTPPR